MKKIKQKKRIKWPRTRLERFHLYGDMGSTERLRFSQTLGDSRGRLASVASVQSVDHDDLSLAASAHGFYAKTRSTSPKWQHGSFGHEPPLANNEESWVEWGTLNSVNTMQRAEHHPDHPTRHHQGHPADREMDGADHRSPSGIASPGNTSRVAFVFDDDPADKENYYRRQARLNHSMNGGFHPTLVDEPLVTTVPSPLDHPGAPRVKSLIWAGQEIATFSDLVWPFVGILGYCIDVGSDVALMLEYLIAELYAWFALTLVFIALPTIAMTVLSIVLWVRNYKVLKEKVSPVQWTMRITSAVFLSTPIMRLVDIFYYGWQTRNTTHDWYTRRMFYEKMIDEETECALVRLFETFLENAPQLVLQLYVITLVGTTKGLVLVIFQVAGLVISWLQMSVSLVSFHTVLRASLQPEKARMTWGGRICMFLWRMFTIASRVVSLALFASHFHFYVFVFIGGHFLIMFIWIINQESSYCQLKQKSTSGTVVVHDGQVSELFFRIVAAAVHVFCFINLLEGPTRLRYGFYYAVMFIENITMAVLWYTFGGTVTETTWYHGPALAIVIGGFLIGLIFQVVYYMWFHPNNHNAAYSDRKIPWCRPCSEMSLIHNVNYKDEDFDDEEEEDEVYVVKHGTHIEPMSRPPTGASNRELQPGYSGQIYHDDYREMMNYEPAHYPSNNGLAHAPMVKQRPKSYLRTSRSPSNAPTPPQSVVSPPHHPLNCRRFSSPEDTPLPPLISQQRRNSAQREQGHAPQRGASVPQRQDNVPQRQDNVPQGQNIVPQGQSGTPQRQNTSPQRQNTSPQRQNHTPQRQSNTPLRQNNAPQRQNYLPQNKQPDRKSYLAAGPGRGSVRGPQWGQAAQQRQPNVGPASPPANTNNNMSLNVSKSTTV